MRYLATLSLAVMMLMIAGNFSIASEDNRVPPESSPDAEQKQNSPELEEKKQKLEKDARELAENFKDIFQDLTGISKAILIPFIEDVSQWIKNNYDELSQQSREKLKKSMKELRKQMNNLDDKSREKSKEVFQDFLELLDDLKEKEQKEKKQKTTDPELVPA